MSLITHVPEPNIWEEICREFQAMRPPFEEVTNEQLKLRNYDASEVTPVFFGKPHTKIECPDTSLSAEFDASSAHPACVGYSFMDVPPPDTPKAEAPAPDKKTCPPREYLEYYIFPYLLPALEAMLQSAKKERCFERKRTKFDALDFLTEYLYKSNPNRSNKDETKEMTLFDIPFVQKHLVQHPRVPLPLSLIWTEEEACLVIQSHLRGYLVRRQPEIQELRVWQREWREENANIRSKVEDFWAEKLPDSQEETSNTQTQEAAAE